MRKTAPFDEALRSFCRRVWMLFVVMAAAAPMIAGEAKAVSVENLVTAPSTFPFEKTIERLEAALRAKEFVLFAKVDHAAGASKVAMKLRPTTVLIFGNPRGGTPLMLANQSAGLELPLKILVWEDAAAKVWLSYDDPAWIARRFEIDPDLAQVKGMSAALAGLAATAGHD